jgi:hypothetical protein
MINEIVKFQLELITLINLFRNFKIFFKNISQMIDFLFNFLSEFSRIDSIELRILR